MKKNPSLQDKSIRVCIVEFYPFFEDVSKGELVRPVIKLLDSQEACAEAISAICP